ncbi:SDR family NAD(P)-dependent oxidoreductase [Sulfidibacter corallicola]|uniref:SDR family NAD(P)-dependent oxidoreductase n=1 Tax=Sulfidibacter corallicola TaxID=2818388 RepID=A0A8A4TWS6_SULCO|nr:SDR family NAD(P)-dependent oxidoreductase [Sulfidibacter corallicola]QTD53422.1 SDR family NAD(P)-dependent oxidoreductase [Sulfidibacter corallicola]
MRNTEAEIRWIKAGIRKACRPTEPETPRRSEPIAIIGLSGYFPQAGSVEAFWQALERDTSLIEEIPKSRFDWERIYDPHRQDPAKLHTKWGGFIPDIRGFDPHFFHILPSEAKLMDPRQRLLLMAVYHCLEDAGYAPGSLKKSATGVFVGSEDNEYIQILAALGKELGEPMGHAPSMIANRISYAFDFRGPSEFVNTMCSGAAVALHRAIAALRSGEIDCAVVAAANLLLRPEPFMGLSAIGQLSPDATVHSFGKNAQGFVRAEGVASVLLKPLARAEADGDPIYALIKHSAVNYNGQGGTSIAAPNTAAHVDVIKRCYREANVDPRDIGYIEAQGMGNPVADIAEWHALNRALSSLATEQNMVLPSGSCAVSTLKPLTGHMHAASALGALFKIVRSLQTDRIYKILNFRDINPELDTVGQPCRLLSETQSWPKSDRPRLAGLHSYGSGGNNAHVLIEEYRHQSPVETPMTQPVLIPVSAQSSAQCRHIVQQLVDLVTRDPDASLARIAHTLQVGRDAMAHRVAFIAEDRRTWQAQARRFLQGEHGNGIFVGEATGDKRRKRVHTHLEDLAEDWVRGADLERPPRGVQVLHLPTYPFAIKDYWFDPERLPQAPGRDIHLSAQAESEPALRQILSGFLEIAPDAIDMDAEFSSLGFNSLLVVHLSTKIEQRFALKVEPALFFEYTTPAQLARYLDRQSGSTMTEPAASPAPSAPGSFHRSHTPWEPIAVIGLAGSYPQASNLERLWQNLSEGRNCVEEVPEARWSLADFYEPDPEQARRTGKSYGKWGGFIDGLYDFDPLFFSLSPREAEYMNPKDRIFLENAWRVLEDAGYPPQQLATERVGVFAGVTRAGVDLQQSSAFSVANRVSYTFNFQGPSMTVDTACSSSLVAIHEACRHIHAGECSVAIAGGVHAFLHPSHFVALSHAQMLSPDGTCKTFGAEANGMVPGEGVGAVMLKPLWKALQDRDRIYGIIRGTETNHGGKTNGFTVPNPKAHRDLVRGAMARGGVHAGQISYVEAHGTGTALGDPIEIRGLTEAFREDTDDSGYCSIGSIKTNIGHLEAAAGISGVTKLLLQLQHRKLVPSLHAKHLNPHIDFGSTPFRVQQELESWQPTDREGRALPRIGCVSSFGAGGTNAHVIIEEYVAPTAEARREDPQDPAIIVLSAKSDDRLRQVVENLHAHLAERQEALPNLHDLAYTLQVGRQALEERLGFVVDSIQELQNGLQAFLEGRTDGTDFLRGHIKRDKASLSLLADEDIAKGVDAWFEKRKLKKILDLWLQGIPVDWRKLYPGVVPSRVRLPSYPFARETYRPKETDGRQPLAPPPTNLPPQEQNPIQTMISHQVWQEKQADEGHAPSKFEKHLVLLCGFESRPPVEIQIQGVSCVALHADGQKNMGQRYRDMALQAFATVKEIILNREKVFVQILIPAEGAGRLFAGLSGLLKTAQQENPKIVGQLVEVAPGVTQSQLCRIIEENRRTPEDAQIRYQADIRQVASWQPVSVPEHAGLPWKERGVYLITGGVGGLGLIFAREIAAESRTLILIGRSPLTPEMQAKLRALESRGARVEYQAVDVSDETAVHALIRDVNQRFGGLTGIIHTAGVLRDSLILKKTEREFATVLAPKVAGTVHLDQATADLDLDFFVLFSSTSAVLGNLGQADYAAANAFLDSFAEYRNGLVRNKQRRGRTLSVNWPFWQDGGMQIGAEAEKILDQTGMVALRTSSGVQALVQGLAAEPSQIMVIEGDLNRIQAAFTQPSKAKPEKRASETPVASGASSEKTADFIKELLSSTIKLPAHEIQAEAPLEAYGIDSIMAMEMTSRLEETFGTLSKTLFFEYQTIQELADYFLEQHPDKIPQLFNETQEAKSHSENGVAPVALETRSRPATATFTGVTNATKKSAAGLDIAIIGVSGRYPQARNCEEYWRNLAEGKDCITEVPADRWDWRRHYDESREQVAAHYSKWGGFIEDADKFDPLFFNMLPREAEFIDPQERIFLETAWAAIEDAGYCRTGRRMPSEVGVYAGVTYSEYQLYGAAASALGTPMTLGGNYASIANRVSYLLNLHGPSMTLDTMCSSSLTTIHQACQDLVLGRTEMALAGGVNLSIHPNKYLMLSIGQFISGKGHCESFGEGGDGYIPGEGVGVVVLKRRHDAEADGDHIYGIIKGSAVNHGGKTNGYSVPNPHAQADVIKRALQESQLDPRMISYIEAHGTGTKLGDPIEITGLTKALHTDRQTGWCAIGSVKSNIGHCESAAGIAGVTKVLLQMKHRRIAPSLHSQTLNPHIDFDTTPFVVNQELREWERPVVDGQTVPRIAGISSFGAGGSNAHLIIEEYVPKQAEAEKAHGDLPVVIPLSARNAERLKEMAKNLLDYLQTARPPDLSALAYTLQVGREDMEERLGLVVHSREELERKLAGFVAGENPVEGLHQGRVKRNTNPLAAFKADDDFAETLAAWFAKRKYARLLDLWTKGLALDWDKLYGQEKPKPISLPTYPFARERYWVPAVHKHRQQSKPPAPMAEQSPEPTTQLITMKPVWNVIPQLEKQAPLPLDAKLLIVGGTSRQIETLRKRHPGAHHVTFSPKASIEEIANHLKQKGLNTLDQILWIAPHGPLPSVTEESLVADQGQGVLLVFRMIKALLSLGYGAKPLGWTLITTQSQAIRDGDPVDPTHAGIHGLAGCLAKEYPHWSVRLLDVEPEWDLQDLFQLPVDPHGGALIRRGEQWFQQSLSPVPELPKEGTRYRSQGVYVVIGGAGGIGVAWSQWMMEHYDARIIWIGRREKDAAIQAKLDALSSFGTPPVYLQADATREASMREAHRKIKRDHPQIHGVIHSAIVLLDRTLAHMDEERFKTGLIAKVDVSVRMAQVFREEPLDFVLFFSSMASFIKAPGQSNYAAGCVFKDTFAHRLAQDWSCAVKVMNWGYWGSVGVAADDFHRDRMKREGMGSIEPEEGMAALASLLEGSLDQVGLMKILTDKAPGAPDTQDAPNPQPESQGSEQVQAKLMQVIRELLLLPEGHALDGEATFSDLGLDSISSVGFIRGLSEEYGLDFRETLVFDYPTIDALTGYIVAQIQSTPPSKSPPEEPAKQASPQPFKQRLGSVMAQRKSVVPLQIEGDGPLLFCLPPMSGDVGVYTKLAEAAQGRFRVIGLRSKGFLSDETPLTTLESMAGDFVQTMTAIDPIGPYHLFGVSVGGTLAYECARQLQQQDKTVKTLLLGEAPLVENDTDAVLWDSDEAHNWVMNANFLMIAMLHMDPQFRERKQAGAMPWSDLEITVEETEGEIPARLPALIKKRGVLQTEAMLHQRLTDMAHTHLINLRALNRYRARAPETPIEAVLLRTRTAHATSPEVYNPDYLVNIQQAKGGFAHFLQGWQRVLPEMETYRIKGENHFDLLSSAETVAHVADAVAEMTTRRKRSPKPEPDGKIAIIGMAGQFPGGQTPAAFWRLLKNGESALSTVPPERNWPKLPVDVHGGFLEDIDRFDPHFFQIAPKEAEMMDPAERFFLQESWRAIEDAGLDPHSLSGKRWGVFCGGGGDYTLKLKDALGVSPHVTSSIPGRVAYHLNLTGPSISLDVGCASSLMAIAQACDYLLLNRCDAAIAGGVSISSTPNLLLASGEMLSKDSVGQAFHADAKGMIPGEGVGVVILKHLDQALADQDRIYGVIEGWASNNSGKTNGMAAPSVVAEAALFSEVYQRFEIDPGSIGLVEANATGTPLGDTIEVQALTDAFRKHTQERNFCALGSVENNIGHAWQASGTAHLFKVLLALRKSVIPATLNAETLNPSFDLENGPFYINHQAVPWTSAQPRRAALSSFGATGTSVHMVISEAPNADTSEAIPETEQPALVVLSATTELALKQRCRDLRDSAERPPLSRLSANLLLRRSHLPVRCAFVADHHDHLRSQLLQYIEGQEPDSGFAGTVTKKVRPSLAQLVETTANKAAPTKADLLLLADCYVQGVPFDLAHHFSGAAKLPLSLPTYPFAKRRCWVDVPGDAAFAAAEADRPSDTEGTLKTQVRTITGLELDEIDVEAPFSHFGMDSLMSIRLLAMINDHFSVEIDLSDLLDHNSIRRVASFIERQSAETHAAPTATGPSEEFSPNAHWLAERPWPESLHLLSLEPEAEPAERALRESGRAMLSQLLQQGVAVFHEGPRCCFLAHRSVDIRGFLNAFSPDRQQELMAQIPLETLIAPLSQEQYRNLYHSEVMHQWAWNIQHVYETSIESLDLATLDQAMAQVVANQDVLRSYFPALNDTWGQFVAPEATLSVERVEFADLDAFKAHVSEQRVRLLNVDQLPIFQAWICRIDRTCYLGFVTHHSLADAFTTTMLFSELMEHYQSLKQGKAPQAVPVTEQYWCYALRQVETHRKEKTRNYWDRQLEGSRLSMRLPYHRDPETLEDDQFHIAEAHAVSLSPSLCDAIKAFNTDHDITHTQLFTGAIALLLIHGMGNPNAAFHFYNSQRDRASLLNTLGEFTNILFLLLDIEPDAKIIDVLQEVKRKSAESLRYAKLDFKQLLTSAGLENHEAFFRLTGDVVIDSADIDTSTLSSSNKHGRSLYAEFSEQKEAADLRATGTLFYQILKVNQNIHLLATYRKHLFDAGEMYGLSTLIVQLVEEMVRRPEHRIADLLATTQDAIDQLRKQAARHEPSQPHRPQPQKANRFPELVHLNKVTGKRPVFWIHGGLGGVEGYYKIAMKCPRPFYGVQARGWMTDRAPMQGVRAMAAFYIHAIQSVQPEGPYDLGGYSLGGLLAYEVARQLQELGQSVQTILMLDSFDGAKNHTPDHLHGKLALFHAVNSALTFTIRDQPEKVAETLLHRDEIDPSLEEEAFLDQLIALAKTRGLTKTKQQLQFATRQNADVVAAYRVRDYTTAPLPDPAAVTCYYFRNISGVFLGEFEPYFTIPGVEISVDHTRYWARWEQLLPNLHIMDVDASSHMTFLSEPKVHDTIIEFSELLYARDGLSQATLTSFKSKVRQAHGTLEEPVKAEETT